MKRYGSIEWRIRANEIIERGGDVVVGTVCCPESADGKCQCGGYKPSHTDVFRAHGLLPWLEWFGESDPEKVDPHEGKYLG